MTPPSDNRAKRRRGGGPKTKMGKGRISQNARQHGLSTVSMPGSRRRHREEKFAAIFAQTYRAPETSDLVQCAAETSALLLEIRELRVAMIKEALTKQETFSNLSPRQRLKCLENLVKAYNKNDVPAMKALMYRLEPDPPDDDQARNVAAIRHLARELGSFERYERRAFSARKTALRKLQGL